MQPIGCQFKKLLYSLDMWLSVAATIVFVGIAFTIIYKTYNRIDHPLLVKIRWKSTLDFFIDPIGLMIQFASMPTFKDKASFSAGKIPNYTLGWNTKSLKRYTGYCH